MPPYPAFVDQQGHPVSVMVMPQDGTGRPAVPVATVSGGGGASSAYGPTASGVAPNTPPVLMAGVDATSGVIRTFWVTANNLNVTQGTKIAGEDLTNDVMKVNQVFSTTYISTATTTTLKTGAGFLHTITVNGGTAGTVIVYDNTAASGTIIASFDSTNALATYTFDCTFSTGLTIITGAATKVSTTWR